MTSPHPSGVPPGYLVAVTWNDLTVIFSGTIGRIRQVHCHKDGRWSRKKTCGDEPLYLFGASATVINGTMYLMGGSSWHEDQYNEICSQDLNSWRWTKLVAPI